MKTTAMLLVITAAVAFAARTHLAFLTREKGANTQLKNLLEARNIATVELPCITFERTDGFDELCSILKGSKSAIHPWIVITSPAAAAFFAEAWIETSSFRSPADLESRIASVGVGSAKVLAAAGLPVDFLPSKADGKRLAAELPAEGLVTGSCGSVLFPTSALAANAIADGLAARGIRTTRIDTYTTAPAVWSAEDLARASSARFVTFGSPSAVRIWTERVGHAAVAVCIGETTAAAAREFGFGQVFLPPMRDHGMPEGNRATAIEAWAMCCAETVEAGEEDGDDDEGPRPVGRILSS